MDLEWRCWGKPPGEPRRFETPLVKDMVPRPSTPLAVENLPSVPNFRRKRVIPWDENGDGNGMGWSAPTGLGLLDAVDPGRCPGLSPGRTVGARMPLTGSGELPNGCKCGFLYFPSEIDACFLFEPVNQGHRGRDQLPSTRQ